MSCASSSSVLGKDLSDCQHSGSLPFKGAELYLLGGLSECKLLHACHSPTSMVQHNLKIGWSAIACYNYRIVCYWLRTTQKEQALVLLGCSAGCLPYKLARLLRETQQVHEAAGNGSGTSVAAALADMFPADLAPLIDMAGKRWAHTVSCMFQ